MFIPRIFIENIELIKSENNIDIFPLFIDLTLTESISEIYPKLVIRLENDSSNFSSVKLSTEDIIRLELSDIYKNKSILLFRVTSLEEMSEGDSGSILNDETNIIRLSCIPAYFQFLGKQIIFKSFVDRNIDEILKSALEAIRMNTEASEIEPSANNLTYYSCKTLPIMLEYLTTNAISKTGTPYISLLKHNTMSDDKVFEFKSIRTLINEGLRNPRILKFMNDNFEDNNAEDAKFLRELRNTIVISSRVDSRFQQEDLFYNRLRNNEIQKLDLFTGQVESDNNYDIRDIESILKLFPSNPDIDDNLNIKMVSNADMGIDNSVKSYFNNKYLLTLLNLHSFILRVSDNLSLHIGDICQIRDYQPKQQNELLKYPQLVTDVAHVVTRTSSESNIRVVPIDPYFVGEGGDISGLKRRVLTELGSIIGNTGGLF